ncbi:MAG TPA: penicillin-binding transpeptidase domain-containing protein [Micromonosporaceae bacterium]
MRGHRSPRRLVDRHRSLFDRHRRTAARSPRRHPWSGRVAAALVALLSVTTGLVACSSDDGPEPVLRAFLAGWPEGNLDQVGVVNAAGTKVASADVVRQIKALSGDLDPKLVKPRQAGAPAVTENDATAAVDVDWAVGGVTWRYRTTVRLNRKDDAWRVVWSPSTLHPELNDGDSLAVRRLPAARAAVVDGAGQAIVKGRPVVVVGIEPQRVTDQRALLAELAAAFKSVGVSVSLADLPAELGRAKPDAFVEVVTLRREAYDQIRDRIRDLPGTVFREGELQLAPTRSFARALLGTVGPVRKDQMDANPGRYVIGDQVGQSGLQQRYDELLRGRPGMRIVITGRGEPGTPEAEPELFRVDPVAGQPLRTTLDQKVQNAADAALVGQRRRAAIVAVRISDGAVVAVANGPDGGELNLAFTASVPPGSTFKMVSALALLNAGAVTPDTPVDCPKTYSVDGRTFNNDHGFALGTVPFRVDFAKSCNTAFASLAGRLGPDGLARTAASVGIGTSWNLGAEVFTGSVATGDSAVDAAAAAFGQGRTLVSPAAMAAATAAVARGAWLAPKLFQGGPPTAPAGPSTAGSPSATPPTVSPSAGPVTPEGTKLNAQSVAALRAMMRQVVTAGTATALQAVPGGPVFAKTGTAEYDNNPANAHSWTIGWQGDLAFAVFVEQGGSSSATAVPIVASFLGRL